MPDNIPQNQEDTKRFFQIGQQEENKKKFISNYVRTTKYTALSFLPLSLFNQFKRYANIYFLIVAILQSIPAISPLNPLSAIAPLVFVISLSMIREGYEDLQRYRSDLQTNSKKTTRFYPQSKEWEKGIEWKDVQVGDVLKVEDEEYFPADLIVLNSSNKNGSCFIMTSSLDGEKNLKPKFALQGTQNEILEGDNFNIEGKMQYGPPNHDLFSFDGELQMKDNYFVGNKQLLLRESQLKNTEYVIGVVVYTGKDTKIMQNADDPRFKQSQIETLMNKLIIVIIIFEIILCLISAIGSTVWNSQNGENYDYFIEKRASPFWEGLLSFFTIFILLNTMIPISLIISLEMVKFAQAYFIDSDIDMKKDGIYSKAYNSSLNEELGQIEYVFSDKTGTLTCNIMEFVYCFVGDTGFGSQSILRTQDEQNKLQRQTTYKNKKAGIEYSFDDQNLKQLIKKEVQGKDENFNLKDQQGNTLCQINSLQKLVEYFMLILSVNHDCMAEEKKNNSNEVNYQGPSPDEVALVDTARHLGYEFKQSSDSGKVININGVDTEIEVLEIIEFTSKRKRSSTIIRHEGVIKMLTKGADSIIIERLNQNEPQPYLDFTIEKLKFFSNKGLRTLCYAIKAISDEEYKQIKERMNVINKDSEKAKKMEQLQDEIERDLILVGCTAVEDKLQDKVPQVIADLIDANIKVWMLTGDKLETAENIGFSCKLVQDDFKKIYLRNEQKKKIGENELKEEYDRIYNELKQKKENDKYCLIVEGPMIINLTDYESLAGNYIKNIFSKCNSVVCCRMSPKQKGEIVRFVKKYQNKITLAIGDGANDVNMIQEAHIGIGLYGKEGMRAVQASDYALPEFKALWKLLFVHGRWSYIRNSEMILYFYYKNVIFALPQFYFCLQNAWSGQTFFDDFYITFYNMAFTALPVIARAVFDQDIYYKEYQGTLKNYRELKQYYHHLYYVGQQNLIFDKKIIFAWLLSAIFGSIIIYFFGYGLSHSFVINESGQDMNLWWLSITVYTTVIFVVDIKILFFTKFFTWFMVVSVFLFSIGIYFVYFFVADYFNIFLIYKTAQALIESPIFYLNLLLLIGTQIIVDVTILILEKELRTPVYLMFRTLIHESDEDTIKKLEMVAHEIKPKLYKKLENNNQKSL